MLSKDFKLENIKNLLLRNSGNDWYEALMRDPLLQRFAASASNVETFEFYPSVLFINGEYWGIIYISKSLDEYSLSDKYGIASDSIKVFKMDSKFNKEKLPADSVFQYLLDFSLANDLRIDSNYQHLLNYIDLDNYVDYCIIEILTVNQDWPDNNIRMWRYNTKPEGGNLNPRDGRWRMMTFDFDWSFGFHRNDAYRFNMLEFVWQDTYRFNILFKRLMSNKGFREYFKTRFYHHLENTFKVEDINMHIDYYYSLLSPEMDEHIARWRYPQSRIEWEKHVKKLREFAPQRIPFQKKEIEIFYSTRF
jgi:hypothetical protein